MTDPIQQKSFSPSPTAGVSPTGAESLRTTQENKEAPPADKRDTLKPKSTQDLLQNAVYDTTKAASTFGSNITRILFDTVVAAVRTDPNNPFTRTFEDAAGSSPGAFPAGIGKYLADSLKDFVGNLVKKYPQIDQRAVAAAKKIMTDFIGENNQIT